MAFLDDHPNYKTYESSDHSVDTLPSAIFSGLQGLIIKYSSGHTHLLKRAINIISVHIPFEPTSNWGWDFLVEDLDTYVFKLSKIKFIKIMDFLIDACHKKYWSSMN